jgi:curli biogenesis system outer membrane secretion channel CsgG
MEVNMKKTFISFLMAFAIAVTGVFAAMPIVAVMDLENKSGWSGYDVGVGMADMLVTELMGTKRVKVIEREQLKKVMEEQQLGMSGMITPQTAAKIGKLLGCQYIITGSVTEYGTSSGGAAAMGIGIKKNTATAALDIRAIDTSSGEILAAVSGKGSKSSGQLDLSGGGLPTDVSIGSPDFNSSQIGQAVRAACKQAADKMVESFSSEWTSSIVKVEGKIVTISGGNNAGLKKGDVFVVMRKGEAMTDPDTGEDLGSEDTEVGKIKVTEVLEKMSKAIILQGDNVQRGDIVKKAK